PPDGTSAGWRAGRPLSITMRAAMPPTLGEIVDFLGATWSGARETRIAGVAPLSEATPEHLAFLSNPKYAPQLDATRAAAVLVAADLEGDDPRWIRVPNPYLAMALVLRRFFAATPRPDDVSKLASIAPTARIGRNAAIGPFVTIADGVTIGDDVTIFQGTSIEAGSAIGDGTTIHANVSIYHGSIIGRRCILHSGVVIGADGYGFALHEGRHEKIPQVGIVRVEDDVEIGAGSTIDRAALGETVIGEGTKIDNLVQVGHNVKIGKHCLLVAQVGIAGSTELGDHVVVAGQSGFAGHLKIGNRVQVAAKSAVLDDVPEGAKVMGTPAVPFREFARRELALKRLMKQRGTMKDER
ncbi:MAG TPA: UDP-3-O-(3-hydroxymyristoyl)glucosamine N-acyltransferase, partial [Thermoanaerobaculia bacterium]|nr:UDP-3-O-(3-hydroxymyristoyl)glucosamine N-acyltransferase [Thermoanaerobaculia bacterium]